MKKIFISTFGLLALFSFSSAFALEINSAPMLSITSDTSISVDWEDVPDALGYYIYYGNESGIENGYKFEGIDLIESSETILENLEKDTDYYVAVTVVDDNGNESQYSPEALSSTSSEVTNTSNTFSLALEEVTVLSSNQIEFEFNTALDGSSDAVREVKVVNKKTGSEIVILSTVLDSSNPMKFIATTEGDLLEDMQYDVTIISVQDMDKNNIESGVNGISSFTVPRGSTTTYKETEQIAVDTIDLETENTELNAAGLEDKEDETEPTVSKAGQTLSDDEIAKTAETAAKDNQALPETGPETVLLFIIAIMLGGGLFLLHAKKA